MTSCSLWASAVLYVVQTEQQQYKSDALAVSADLKAAAVVQEFHFDSCSNSYRCFFTSYRERERDGKLLIDDDDDE